MNGYEFLPKTPELIMQRRVSLAWYANLAQFSQLLVHLIIPAFNLVASVPVRRFAGNTGQKGIAAVMARTTRILKVTLGTEMIKGYGTYGQWIFGIAWTVWLGFLCTAETAPDYLHLTKRFGLIAASQLPIHYLLSMSHQYSPLVRSSYKLNMALHKVTGKIIIALLAVHISLYSIFFVQMGMFWEVIRHANIVVAIISSGILFILGITATGFFRRRYYWWFYRLHVIGSALVLPLLFFHVKYIRIYIFESAVVLIINASLRLFSSPKL